eukprot:CAMPEP_0115754686 /NCGR_PEP_ID=MMETSP0272-20121206/96998_1 /TAXON_ID=71861 /ORGANISM="Scrippsiella trochoidea, Strain CCMP3099" /LENGTH=143 /DNA_ID=CAMNT_0003200101 /DNA_START=73 /DNA_END=501 /DNA_ORIENTATION=+
MAMVISQQFFFNIGTFDLKLQRVIGEIQNTPIDVKVHMAQQAPHGNVWFQRCCSPVKLWLLSEFLVPLLRLSGTLDAHDVSESRTPAPRDVKHLSDLRSNEGTCVGSPHRPLCRNIRVDALDAAGGRVGNLGFRRQQADKSIW